MHPRLGAARAANPAPLFSAPREHRDASGGSTASVWLQHVSKTNRNLQLPVSTRGYLLILSSKWPIQFCFWTESVLFIHTYCRYRLNLRMCQIKRKKKKRRKGFSQSGRKTLYKPGSRWLTGVGLCELHSVAIMFGGGERRSESEKSALSVLVEQGLHFPELTVYTAALGHPESAGIGRASSCNSPAQIAGMI